MHLNQYIGANAVQLKREEMGNATRIQEAKINAAARSGDRAYQIESLEHSKALAANSVAQQRLATAIGDVEKAKSLDKPYTNAQNTINTYNAMMEKNKDVKNYKPHPQITADAQAAEKLVQQREDAYSEKLRIVKAEAARAEKRLDYTENPRDKGKEKEKDKGTNKPTVSNWK
jgi:hypothetical protein